MRNKLLSSILIIIIAIMTFGTIQVLADSTADNYNNYVYPMSTYKKPVAQPFSLSSSGQTESISPASGGLEITQTDLSLKGKNGLDFNLTRMYSTSEATLYEPYCINKSYATFLIQGYYITGSEITEVYENGVLIPSKTTIKTVNFCAPPSPNSTNKPYAVMATNFPDYTYCNYWKTSQEAQKMADDLMNGNYNYATTSVNGSVTTLTVVKYNDKLDFAVQMRYEHVATGQYWYFNNEVIYLPEGSAVPVVKQYWDSYTDTTTNDRNFNIGTGWSLDLPYIENRDNQNSYLHLGSSGTFYFSFDTYLYEATIAPQLPGGYNFTFEANLQSDSAGDYKLYYIINKSSQPIYANSETTAKYKLVHKDGKVMYFGSDGRLMLIQDKFGNEIKFYHSTSINGYPLITQIVDSVGRTIDFSYAADKVTIKVNDATNSSNNRELYYNKAPSKANASKYVLDSVTDPEGKITKYEYEEKEGNFSFKVKDPYSNTSNDASLPQGKNIYEYLKRIIYPTGGKTEYNYNDGRYSYHNLGLIGFQHFYKILDRADYSDDGKKYNYKKYNYYNYFNGDGALEYDGYPTYDGYSIPDSFQVRTDVASDNGNTDAFTYNYIKNDNNKRTDLLCSDILSKGIDYQKETINTYNKYSKLLSQSINRTYNKNNGKYIDYIQNYVYNQYKDLTDYWDIQAGGNTSDYEHKTTFNYNDTYHYLTSKTYKKDADTRIVEEYVPYADDAKKIEWYRLKENGTIKKQTRFIYDTYGNVTQEWQYKNDLTNYIVVNYSYDDNVTARNGKFNGAYVTKKWVDGIKDTDGANLGTIDEKYTYDWFGNVVSKADGKGQAVSYEYDKLNRVKKQINADSSFKSYEYITNATDNYVIVKDENANSTDYASYGNQTKYVFDKLGNMVAEQIWAKNTAGNDEYITRNQYTFDSRMKLKNEKNLINGGSINYTYTSDGRIQQVEVLDTKNSNNLVYKESYAYEDSDAAGLYSIVTKTVKGETGAADVVTKSYINKIGKVEKQESMHLAGSYTNTFKYDYLGNKIEEKSARAADEGWANAYTARYKYNYAGKLIDTETVEGKHLKSEYDALGRMTATIDYKGNKSTFEYDDIGRLIKQSTPFEDGKNSVKKNYYDASGNVLKVLTSSNKPGEDDTWDRTDYEYNVRNMLTKLTTYADVNTPENYSQYFYDKNGNKIRMYTGLSTPLTINGLDNVAAGSDNEYSTTKYSYNNLGKLISKIDPSGKEETYTYDLNGTLLSEKDRMSSTLTYSFDILQRLTGKSVATADGAGNEAYSYGYFLTGARKSMSGGGIDTTYSYDDMGRLVKETETNGITKDYTYDATNNRKSFVIKQGDTVISNTTYEYDTMNRLSKVYENKQLIATYTYDENGNRDTLTYGNGVNVKYDYNTANKLKAISNKNAAGAVISQYSYGYYLDGNQAAKTDTEGVTNYKYDGLGRINNVEGPNGLFKKYGYDDKNNRSLLSGNGEIYENPEDMTYSYDGFNQLKTAIGNHNAAYTYNADGIRTTKVVDGVKTTQVLDGGNVAAEIVGTSATKYIRGVNLLAEEKNGQRYYYLYNGHGDVVQMVDSSGNVVNNYEYDEWGNIKSQTEGVENPFKYCGEYFDKETGLYYLRARYYDPTIGRFISEDSYPGEDNDPLSLNLYTYCKGNPIIFFDPNGHEPTVNEAAAMATQIYEEGKEGENLIGGWVYYYSIKGADGMKMGMYYKYKEDGSTELAIVNKGTTPLNKNDWKNNIQQISGSSSDMKESIKWAKLLSNYYFPNKEITFVGHSKGGAEAAANAMATNKNAIIFNPASVNYGAYDLDTSSYTGSTTAYVVTGEILDCTTNNILGKYANTVYLPQQYGGHWYEFWDTTIGDKIHNHLMSSVKSALKEREKNGDN